jgi:hypothetical protein
VTFDFPSQTADDVATPEPLEKPSVTPTARVPLAYCSTVCRLPVAGFVTVSVAR